jgi:hypothetical protein
MFECVHALINLTQNKDLFMCDFLIVVKLAQQKLYWLYYDLFAKYEVETFDYFNSIEAWTNDSC